MFAEIVFYIVILLINVDGLYPMLILYDNKLFGRREKGENGFSSASRPELRRQCRLYIREKRH